MLDKVTRSLTDFFPYEMLRQEEERRLNSTTKHQLHIYLFVNLPYAQLKGTNLSLTKVLAPS